ncbi:MAG TPA: hypothetical protein V6C86_17630 [Oculatellaceae cyanobacterium]
MNELDQIVMLLSTDWFLECWNLLGLDESRSVRLSIQHGCRRVVEQILGSAKSYWNATFSAARLGETETLLRKHLVASKCSKDHVELILYVGRIKDDRQRDLQMVHQATYQLVLFGEETSPMLSARLIEQIRSTWNSYSEESEILEAAFNDRSSSWDMEISALTTDIPGYLLDHALVITKIRKTEMFFRKARQILEPAEFNIFTKALISIKPKLANSQVLTDLL